MKKIFTPLFCLFFFCDNTFSQIPKSPVSVQTPNAASFNALGDYKVSSFVGNTGIDVGLCKITDGVLDIPISLNYNATGVKPDAHSGWVGLNMNLAVGGSIVRTAKDLTDDNSFTLGLGTNSLGFFYSRSVINSNNWSTNAGIRTIANYEAGALDTEADEFSFNMMGKISGKFYLGSDGNWKVQSEQAIKVEIIGNASNTSPLSPLQPLQEILT